MPQPIDEAKDKEIIESWYVRKEGDSIDTLVKELNDHFDHDYGSICHAVAASAVRAAWAMDAQSQGGITGFQAGAVMWEFIKHWMHYEGPMRLVRYDDMLYPQHAYKYEKTISKDTWEYLQKKAQENIDNVKSGDLVAGSVFEHWRSIVNGVVPFGYTISED